MFIGEGGKGGWSTLPAMLDSFLEGRKIGAMHVQEEACLEGDLKTGQISARPYWLMIVTLFVRSAHQASAGVFLATCLFEAVWSVSRVALLVAAVTGVLLLSSEWMRHRQILKEVAGLITIIKAFLLGAAWHGFMPLGASVVIVFAIASLGAHMPKSVRHRLVLR